MKCRRVSCYYENVVFMNNSAYRMCLWHVRKYCYMWKLLFWYSKTLTNLWKKKSLLGSFSFVFQHYAKIRRFWCVSFFWKLLLLFLFNILKLHYFSYGFYSCFNTIFLRLNVAYIYSCYKRFHIIFYLVPLWTVILQTKVKADLWLLYRESWNTQTLAIFRSHYWS